MIEVFVKPCKPAAGEVVLNTAVLAAAAAGEREVTPHHRQRIHRQPDMAKFTGNIAMSGNRFAVEDQATDRAYRIGQKQSVQVYKLIAKNTIEEKIYALQERKKEMIDSVIQPGENFLGKLSEAELRELFL